LIFRSLPQNILGDYRTRKYLQSNVSSNKFSGDTLPRIALSVKNEN
jgi:hypothetical protein